MKAPVVAALPAPDPPLAAVPPVPPSDRRVEVAAGLLEPKHRRAMGPALHLYLYLLSRKPFGSVYAYGGRSVPLALLAALQECSEREVRRWIARLERHGYIRVARIVSGPVPDRGLRIRITKARDWRAGRVRRLRDPLEG